MSVVSKPSTIWRLARDGNYGIGRRSRISRITFHHIVGDAPAALDRFQNTNDEVSATYVIGSDGQIFQCVTDNDTPYTDANSDSNSRAITIEHAGGHPNVPYTDAMYASSARLVAWLIQQYGISDFKRHRDVSDEPTSCPGALDVERIVNQAKQLLKGEDEMSEGEAKALADVLFWALPGRKVKDSELREYVPMLMSKDAKQYDKMVQKLLSFDETKKHLGITGDADARKKVEQIKEIVG